MKSLGNLKGLGRGRENRCAQPFVLEPDRDKGGDWEISNIPGGSKLRRHG
jgi:hypothetical protein